MNLHEAKQRSEPSDGDDGKQRRGWCKFERQGRNHTGERNREPSTLLCMANTA
jgi:hypothetical protein